MSHEGPSYWERTREAVSFFGVSVLGHNRKTRPHWSEIIDGLYLGGIPIETSIWGWGNHGEKLMQQCENKQRPLKLVVSVNENWELEGYGFLWLKPVSTEYWQTHGVIHRVCHFKDFGANITVQEIKNEVDLIHQAMKEGFSSLVHCKAGRGRSFAIVMCYLVEKHGLSPEEAFFTIISKRPHVSPSISQFLLVEQYRKTYHPDLPCLDLSNEIYAPYRKEWSNLFNWSFLTGMYAGFKAIFSNDMSYFVQLMISLQQPKYKLTTSNFVHNHPDRLLEYPKPITERHVNEEAFLAGKDAASWSGWFLAWGYKKTYTHYADYQKGLEEAKQEIRNKPK